MLYAILLLQTGKYVLAKLSALSRNWEVHTLIRTKNLLYNRNKSTKMEAIASSCSVLLVLRGTCHHLAFPFPQTEKCSSEELDSKLVPSLPKSRLQWHSSGLLYIQ